MEFRVYADNDPLPRLLIVSRETDGIDSRLIASVLKLPAAKEYWRLYATNQVDNEQLKSSRVLQVSELNSLVDFQGYIKIKVAEMLDVID